jgi:hypothetical protein
METNMNSNVRFAKDVKIQLDHFDGINYTRWMDKMVFLLTSLKIYYILNLNLPALPEPQEVVCYAQNSKAYRLLDLKTNVIVESIHVEFIKNKFISDSNVQEPNLKVMTPSSMLSEKHKKLEVIGSNEPKKS